MGGRGSSSSSGSSGSKKMSGINGLFNKEIEKFNNTYKGYEQGTEKQKGVTKQVKGLVEINTNKSVAKRAWDFSNNVNKVHAETKKLVDRVNFKSVPKGAITKESKEYRERKANGEKPKTVYTGFKETTFNKLSNVVNDYGFGKGSADLERVLFKKVNYYKKK